MEDDETDEIVQEIPVFLNQNLDAQLYLLQYPLRPFSRPYEKDMGSSTMVRDIFLRLFCGCWGAEPPLWFFVLYIFPNFGN